MYTVLSVKQCDCLYLEVVMSVMSFLNTTENNLAIWILSITPCLQALLPGREVGACVQGEVQVLKSVCVCVNVLV